MRWWSETWSGWGPIAGVAVRRTVLSSRPWPLLSGPVFRCLLLFLARSTSRLCRRVQAPLSGLCFLAQLETPVQRPEPAEEEKRRC